MFHYIHYIIIWPFDLSEDFWVTGIFIYMIEGKERIILSSCVFLVGVCFLFECGLNLKFSQFSTKFLNV